jgi:hypothetical protein
LKKNPDPERRQLKQIQGIKPHMRRADKKPILNAAWHEKHHMPKNPSLQQRIDWHLEHYKNCACREIPAKLKEEMKKRNIKIPGL